MRRQAKDKFTRFARNARVEFLRRLLVHDFREVHAHPRHASTSFVENAAAHKRKLALVNCEKEVVSEAACLPGFHGDIRNRSNTETRLSELNAIRTRRDVT